MAFANTGDESIFKFDVQLRYSAVIFCTVQRCHLKVNGNKNRKVVLDGRTYTMTNRNAKANNKNITLTHLQPGKHTIQVIRTNKTTNTAVTSFTLRSGYDVVITVSGTGAAQVREKKHPVVATNGVLTPMAATAFNTLQQEIRNQWQAGAKLNIE